MSFKKYQVLVQNPKGLPFNFTKKCMFAMKIGWTSEFHPREAHILSRLEVLVLYIHF
jgi:hypothetical protein